MREEDAQWSTFLLALRAAAGGQSLTGKEIAEHLVNGSFWGPIDRGTRRLVDGRPVREVLPDQLARRLEEAKARARWKEGDTAPDSFTTSLGQFLANRRDRRFDAGEGREVYVSGVGRRHGAKVWEIRLEPASDR